MLVRLTVFDELVVLICWMLKVRLVGDRLTVVAPPLVPVPVRLTVCGLPLALSVIVIVPFCAPVAVGVNVTLMVHSRWPRRKRRRCSSESTARLRRCW